MIDYKKLRAVNNLSQSGLAKVLGVSPKSLFNYEKGDSSITLNQLRQLSEHFETTPVQFLKKYSLEETVDQEQVEMNDRLIRIENMLKVMKTKLDFLYTLQSKNLVYDKLAQLEHTIAEMEEAKLEIKNT